MSEPKLLIELLTATKAVREALTNFYADLLENRYEVSFEGPGFSIRFPHQKQNDSLKIYLFHGPGHNVNYRVNRGNDMQQALAWQECSNEMRSHLYKQFIEYTDSLRRKEQLESRVKKLMEEVAHQPSQFLRIKESIDSFKSNKKVFSKFSTTNVEKIWFADGFLWINFSSEFVRLEKTKNEVTIYIGRAMANILSKADAGYKLAKNLIEKFEENQAVIL